MVTLTVRPTGDSAVAGGIYALWNQADAIAAPFAQYIDEEVADDADYIRPQAIGAHGVFAMGTEIPDGATDISLTVYGRFGAEAATTYPFRFRLDPNANDPTSKWESADKACAGVGAVEEFSNVWATNPAGGAWTPATANATQMGVSLDKHPSTAQYHYCTQLWGVWTYTPAAPAAAFIPQVRVSP
jgi:hypothetical protein